MKSPKPTPKGKPQLNSAELTTRGSPRKRAAGAGRPARTDPRTKTMPRITPAAHQQFQAIARAIARPGKAPSLADAIEHAARVALAKLKPKP
jgi:hypothetical protein